MRFNRELLKGNVETIVLDILSRESLYGYRLVKEINKRSDGILRFGEGTVYPVLYKLEKQGLLKSFWQKEEGSLHRKYYQLTDKGRKVYIKRKTEWAELAKGMQLVLGKNYG